MFSIYIILEPLLDSTFDIGGGRMVVLVAFLVVFDAIKCGFRRDGEWEMGEV